MTDEQKKKIEWLGRAKKAEKSVRYWLSRLEHDRELARGSTKGLSCSGTGNSSKNSTEDLLIRLADAERKVQDKMAELAYICNEIADAIEAIDDEELQAVLVWHYLKYLTWEEVAYKMHCDLSTVKRKHRKALGKLTLNELA